MCKTNPQLFKCFAYQIVALKDLSGFNAQDLSNIAWAYATVGESNLRLFKRLAHHIVALKDLSGFNSRALFNIIWAYATTGESNPWLFKRFVDHKIVALKDLSPSLLKELNPVVFVRCKH